MKYLRLLLVPPALLCVLIIRLISPWYLIRFGESWAHRVGHLVGNNECYLCERDDGRHKGIDIFCHRYGHANRYLERMFNRVMPIDRTKFTALVSLCNKMFRGWEKHIAQAAQLDRDVYNLFEKYPPHLKFTAREERRGRAQLLRMGIPVGARFVCLIVRDGAYLPQLGYHKHRDSDIMNYIPAALELAKRGYYVLRMGAKVAAPMQVRHSHIIDYATNGMRSEFMDVYLGARCDFCISTGTGFDAIPMIFRRPICYVNYVPLEYLMTFVYPSLAIWRHHVRDGRRMVPKEIYASGAGAFMRADEFQAAGITLEENSYQEIIDVVLEMHEYLHGEWAGAQQDFWNSFPVAISPYNGKPLHGRFRMRIGARFLESYEKADRKAGHKRKPPHKGRAVRGTASHRGSA